MDPVAILKKCNFFNVWTLFETFRGMAGCRRGPGHSRYLTGFMDDPPNMPTPVHRYDQQPPQTELFDLHRPPEANLIDTVAHLQLEVDALKFVQSGPSTSATKVPPVQSKRAAFTSAKVLKFSGMTSCDQYRQVFLILLLGQWVGRRYGRPTTHLEGDALNWTAIVCFSCGKLEKVSANYMMILPRVTAERLRARR